jgi:hypothetical protein
MFLIASKEYDCKNEQVWRSNCNFKDWIVILSDVSFKIAKLIKPALLGNNFEKYFFMLN